MDMFELRDRLARYFAFTTKEVQELAIAVLIVGFIFSFRDWGVGGNIDFLLGLRNLVLTILVAAISFFVHESVHRVFALWIGFKAEFKIWWGGLITGLILVFASNGRIQLILPGGVVLALLVRHRLGEFRYGLNYWENGIIALYGPLSNLFLAFVAKLLLYLAPNSFFFSKLLYLNIIFAICLMLPIPPLDGINTFFASRVLYISSFFGIVISGILIYFTGILLSLIGGAIAAFLALALYYFSFEQKNS